MTVLPSELRDLLAEAGIDVRSPIWPAPGFVIAAGDRYRPHPEPGVLIVNTEPLYSASWR